MDLFIKILFLVLAYLIGSIPWGYVIGRLKGIDITKEGSKNIGATNTGRVLGKKYAILAYVLDMLKGFIFVFLFRFEIIPSVYLVIDPIIYGLLAVLGHTFSIYLKFKGGKAVATGGGVVFAYCPILVIVAFLTFGLVTYFSTHVSLGSLVTTVVLAICGFVLFFIKQDPLFPNLNEPTILLPICLLIIATIIFVRHSSNIKALIKHEERSVSWGRKKHN